MKNFILTLLLLAFTLLAITPSFAVVTSEPVPNHVTAISQASPTHAIPINIAQQTTPKKRSTTLLLLLIGVFALPIGLHRFYLGYTTEGAIMLILALTGIGLIVSWIWTLIDLIKFLNGTLKPADGSEYIDAESNVI